MILDLEKDSTKRDIARNLIRVQTYCLLRINEIVNERFNIGKELNESEINSDFLINLLKDGTSENNAEVYATEILKRFKKMDNILKPKWINADIVVEGNLIKTIEVSNQKFIVNEEFKDKASLYSRCIELSGLPDTDITITIDNNDKIILTDLLTEIINKEYL